MKKVKKDGSVQLSTMFPNNWSNYDIIKAINEAFENRVISKRGIPVYVGKTSSGIEIEMIIQNNKITTSYPVY